jgi:hypothetical protein
MIPLLGEALLLSLAGFLVGLALAYLLELHNRSNRGRRW